MGKASWSRTNPEWKLKIRPFILLDYCFFPISVLSVPGCFTKVQDIYGNLYKEDKKCKHAESSSSDLTCNNIEKWRSWINKTRFSRPCCSTSPHSANRQTSSDKVRNDTRLGQNINATMVDFSPPPFHVAFHILFWLTTDISYKVMKRKATPAGLELGKYTEKIIVSCPKTGRC